MLSPIPILDIGWQHDHADNQSLGIDQQVALAALYEFAAIEAATPPLCVVLTD